MVDSPFILLYATIFRTGKGNNRRDIDISKYFELLVPDRCKVLVAFYVFTGCDQTGRFNNKLQTACWKAFLSSSNIILHAFSRLMKGGKGGGRV